MAVGKTGNLDIIDWLLINGTTIDTTPISSIKAWKKKHDAHTCQWAATIERAVAGGFLADRVAYAFAAGYNAALQKLVPDLPLEAVTAICVTEKHGGHPGAIQTRLEKVDTRLETGGKWKLNGFKQFVTSAEDATHFLVAASAGKHENGRNRIRLVCVEHDITGLLIQPMGTPLPFIPEIGMGTMTMQNIVISDSQILPGDGYRDYVKPFRTLEDLHIAGAMMGYLLRISCVFDWPKRIREHLLSLITAVKPLSLIPPDLPHGHIILEGIFGQMKDLMQNIDPLWENLPEDTRAMWYRDRVIVNTADKVRVKRLANAWRHYGYHI